MSKRKREEWFAYQETDARVPRAVRLVLVLSSIQVIPFHVFNHCKKLRELLFRTGLLTPRLKYFLLIFTGACPTPHHYHTNSLLCICVMSLPCWRWAFRKGSLKSTHMIFGTVIHYRMPVCYWVHSEHLDNMHTVERVWPPQRRWLSRLTKEITSIKLWMMIMGTFHLHYASRL